MVGPVSDALLAQQQADYETVAVTCNGIDGCVGITLWDYTDKVTVG